MRSAMRVLTAKNLDHVLSVVPNARITMYGMNVIKNNITADTEPMLADEKNVEIM